ncbi:MAG TPA: DUF6531 domain-containing protein, partial [Acidimicrobiales bacterium]|nr:DUF6531 domain-containing protein [Acidimicrobiales bacterium]
MSTSIGMPLALTRTYDSGLAQAQSLTSTASSVPGGLGYGWSYNLGMSLSTDPSTGVATISQENGSEVTFSPYVAGSSPSWCTGTTNYCADQPRVVATLDKASDDTWTLVRYAHGAPATFRFSATGQLVSETDTVGDSLTSSTQAPGAGQCPSGAASCTVWESSASGRSLTLAFDAAGLLTAAIAPGGEEATYCYYGQACADGAGGGGPADLYSASAPGEGTTTYTYDSSGPDPVLANDIVTEQLPTGGTVTNVYNSAGQVVSQDAPSGYMTFSYSGSPESYEAPSAPGGGPSGTTVVSLWPTGPGGPEPAQVTEYQYSSGALVAETTGYGTKQASTRYFDLDPATLVPTTTQDGDGNQDNVILDTTSGPMAAGNVTSSTDALGNTTQTEYNADNQAWCTVSPSEYLDGVRCPAAEPTSPPGPGASDPWAGATINFYDTNGNLTATTDPLGRTSAQAYTPSGLSVPAGLVYCSVEPVEYAQGVTCPAYGAAHVAGTTSSTFDAAGDVTSSTDTVGGTTTYTYGDPSHPGMPTVTTGPDGDKTTVVYNSAGQVISSTQSSGGYSATTLTAYDSAGQAYCTVAPQEVAKGVTCPASPPSSPVAGATTDFYDAAGHLVLEVGPTGATTAYAYDSAGNQYCTVAPAAYEKGARCPDRPPASAPAQGDDAYAGATIDTYDAQGRLVQTTSSTGAVTTYAYDGAGNRVSQTTQPAQASEEASDPAVTTTYTYNADNQQVSATTAPGTPLASTTLSYHDPDGNIYCTVPADAYASGNYQCPAWQASWAVAPPPVGSLYSSTPSPDQANAVATSFYDADGELLQSSGPNEGTTLPATTVSAYDANGNVYCAEDATDMAASLAAQPSGSYPYTCPSTAPSSAPATGSDPGYETSIYDPAGRLLSSTDATGATTSYTYGPEGEVLTTTNPDGAVTTDCYYWQRSTCAAGAPASGGDATDLYSTTMPPGQSSPQGALTTYTYYPGGQVATKTTPAGTESYSYDAAGDTLAQSWSAPAPGYQATPTARYTYDGAGQLASVSDIRGTTSLSYDQAGQLLSASTTSTTPTCEICATATSGTALEATGAAVISAAGTVADSSTSPSAAQATGSARVSGSSVVLAGGSKTTGTASVGPLAAPGTAVAPSSLPVLPAPALTATATSIDASANQQLVASPGVYSDLEASGAATLSLSPGTYVVTGKLAVGGSGQLTGTGVSIYLACASYPAPCAPGTAGASVSVSGNGLLAISGAQVGSGPSVAIYSDVSNAGSFELAGSGKAELTGSADVPSMVVSLSGSSPLQISKGVLVAASVQASGSATVSVDQGQGAAPPATTSTVSYSYFSTGQRESITYPQAPVGGSATVNYSYDQAGAMASLTDWYAKTTTFSHDPDGNTTATAYPDGVNVSDSFDLAGAMTALTATASDGTLAAGISYGLDSAEQVSAETDAGALSGSVNYSYDSADRLGTVAKGASTPASAAYDPAGNPTTLATGATQAFDRAGELTSATEPSGAKVAYTYNPSGDRTGATTTAPSGTTTTSAYGYSQADMMTTASVPGALPASYSYDANGLLASTSSPAGVRADTWDMAAGLALLLTDATNDYLYGPTGTPVEQAGLVSNNVQYFVPD